MAPASGAVSPAISPSSVVLPAPPGPITPVMAPGGSANDRPPTSARSPRPLIRFLRLDDGGTGSGPRAVLQPRPGAGRPHALRHPQPFELPLQGVPPVGCRLRRGVEPLPLLLQPGRVAAAPGDGAPVVELENPVGDAVEEAAVARGRHDGAAVGRQVMIEPRRGLGVQVGGGIVEQQQVRRLQQQPAEREAAAFRGRQRACRRVSGRQPERVRERRDARVKAPCAGGVERLLQPALRLHRRPVVDRSRRELGHHGVVLLQQLAEVADAGLDGAGDGLGAGDPRLGREIADRDAGGRTRLPLEFGQLPRHDPEQRRLAGAGGADDAEPRAGRQRQPQVAERRAFGREGRAQALQRVDRLGRRHRSAGAARRRAVSGG